MFLDGDAVNAIQVHGHGTSCTYGVTTHIVGGVSELLEPKGDYSPFEGVVDVIWANLSWCAWKLKVCAECCVLIGCVCHDVSHPTCESLNRTGDLASTVVMDALPPFPVLLVGDSESGMGCS